MPYATKSLSFDGSSKYVTCGDVLGTLVDRTSTFSISLWVKTSISAPAAMVARQDETSLPSGWDFEIDGTRITLNIVNTWATNCIAVYSDPVVTMNDGEWHHVCCTFDGSGLASGVRFYIDGTPKNTGVTYDNLVSDVYMAGTALTFGRRDVTTSYLYFAGNLCQCTMYDRVLTPSEVSSLYNGGNPMDPEMLSSSSALVGYWPLGEGDTYPDALETVLVPTVPMTAGRKSTYYQLPNEEKPLEWCRGENMLSDMAVFYPGPGGVCPFASNMGVNSFYRAGPINYKAATDSFSISIWFKYSYSNQRFGSLVTRAIGYDRDGYLLRTDYYIPGAMAFAMRGGNGTGYLRARTTVSGFNDNNWHHVVFTYNGNQQVSGCHLWVDGVDEPLTVDYDQTLTAMSYDSFNIAGYSDQAGAQSFEGLLTQSVFYDTALGSSDVAALYNGGTPVDPTGLASATGIASYWDMGLPDGETDFPGTLLNMDSSNVVTGPGGALPKALKFNGTDESVEVGNYYSFERDQPFSIAFWFKIGSTGVTEYPFGKDDGTFRGYVSWMPSTGELNWVLSYQSGSTNRARIQTVATFNDDTWHQAVFCYDGSSTAAGLTIYVDGSLQAVTVVDDTLSSTIMDAAPLRFGQRGSNSMMWSGSLTGFHIYAVELQAADATALWNGGTPVDPTGLASAPYLVGYWELGSGYYPGTMVGMSSGDIVDDAPHVSSLATEKTWVTTANYEIPPGSYLLQLQSLLLDWKDKLATIGWTVIGSGNSTVYEWAGVTGGGSYGGSSTGPYDVWASTSDIVFRDSDLGPGPMSWVTLRSPLSPAGQFYITLVAYASIEYRATAYAANQRPNLPGDPLNDYPSPSSAEYFWLLNNEEPHKTSTSGMRIYFSGCSADGSFVFYRQKLGDSYWSTSQQFHVLTTNEAEPDSFPMRAVGLRWYDTGTIQDQWTDWRLYSPIVGRGVTYAHPFGWVRYPGSGAYLELGLYRTDYLRGTVQTTPVHLILFGSESSTSFSSGLTAFVQCRVPDIFIHPTSIPQGSQAPAVGTPKFISTGFLWFPGDTVPVFT